MSCGTWVERLVAIGKPAADQSRRPLFAAQNPNVKHVEKNSALATRLDAFMTESTEAFAATAGPAPSRASDSN